jgi:hypothetical protein
MMIKAVVIFLLAMAALGMAGKWRRRREPRTRSGKVEPARKCSACGAYLIGGAPCACGRPGAAGS